MTESNNQSTVFPRQDPPDIPSHVSSLTRADLEHYLAWVTDSDAGFELSDWQWRVLVALGLLTEQTQFVEKWRATVRGNAVMIEPAGVLQGPAEAPGVPPACVVRTVADQVVAKRAGDGQTFTISDLVSSYNNRLSDD